MDSNAIKGPGPSQASSEDIKAILVGSRTPPVVDAKVDEATAEQVKDSPRVLLTRSDTPKPVEAAAIHGEEQSAEDHSSTAATKQVLETDRVVLKLSSKPQPVDPTAILGHSAKEEATAATFHGEADSTSEKLAATPNKQSTEPDRVVLKLTPTPQPVDAHSIRGPDTDGDETAVTNEESTKVPDTSAAKIVNEKPRATQDANVSQRLVLSFSPTPQKVDLDQAVHARAISMDGTIIPVEDNSAQDTVSSALKAASQRRIAEVTELNAIPLTSEPRLVVKSNHVLRLSKHPRSPQSSSRDLRHQPSADEMATTRSILEFAKYVSATPTQAAKALELNDDTNATASSEGRLPVADAQDFAKRVLGFSEAATNAIQNQVVGAALGSAVQSDRIVLTRSDPKPGDDRAELYRLLTRRVEAQRASQRHNAPGSVHPQTPVTNISMSPPGESTLPPAEAEADAKPQVIVTDKVGTEDFIRMPISVLSQNSESVTFELTQTWADDALNWMAIEYSTDFGWTCPSFERVSAGKLQLFTAKCENGQAQVSIFCRHFSFEGDARTPGYCNAPQGNKIATYFSLPCVPSLITR